MKHNWIKIKEVHRNIPQLTAQLVDAAITVVIFGRGTGKTRGVTAGWIYRRAKELVRSCGFVCSPTYAHLVDTVIPELQQGWADFGLKRNVHYWLYEFPPAELRIPAPFLEVDNPKYFIFWINGSVTKLVSTDRKALVNSKSFDYGAFVEGRKLDGQTVTDDIMPTIRGGRANTLPDGRVFGDIVHHHAKLIESDLPRNIKGRWFLRYQKQSDKETIRDILTIQKRIITLRASLKTAKKKDSILIQEEIELMNSAVNEMRKDLVYVGKAATYDNLHVLGTSAIKSLRRSLTDYDWDVSVLNIEQEEIPNCFYSSISKEVHGYENAINYTYIDSIQGRLKHDWRWDKDLNYSKGLDIVMDCNNAHNCMGILQSTDKQINLLNYLYCLSIIGQPTDHTTIAQMVCDYYEGFPTKEIKLIYNHTMIAGKKHGKKAKSDDVVQVFRKNKWQVAEVYLGQAMEHDILFTEWARLCTGKTKLRFRFNYQRCAKWYECCKAAGVLLVTNRKGEQIKKNKSSEKETSGILPEDATHATEAIDQYIQYKTMRASASKAMPMVMG